MFGALSIPDDLGKYPLLYSAWIANQEDSRHALSHTEHLKRLYPTAFEPNDIEVRKYAVKIWNDMLHGIVWGVTGDIFFRVLFLVQKELTAQKRWRHFGYLLREYPSLRAMFLGAVFGLTNHLGERHDPISEQPRVEAIKSCVSLLQNKLQDKKQLFAFSLFSYCREILHNLSPLWLHTCALESCDLAHLILINSKLFKQFSTQSLVTQDNLVKMIANIVERNWSQMTSWVYFGERKTDYFLTLFTRIFETPSCCGLLLASKFLTKAASGLDGTETNDEVKALQLIQRRFYQSGRDADLVLLLKKYPALFVQLMGRKGKRLVDLASLSKDPLELIKFFAWGKETEAQKILSDNAHEIILNFARVYPQHLDRLLKIKVGGIPFIEHLSSKLQHLTYAQSPEELSQLSAILAHAYLTEKLDCSVAECRQFLSKNSPKIELAMVSNEYLWRLFAGYSPMALENYGVYFQARLMVEQGFKELKKDPGNMDFFTSLVVVNTPKLWKAMCPKLNWLERTWLGHFFGAQARYERKLIKLKENAIFAARLDHSANPRVLQDAVILEAKKLVATLAHVSVQNQDCQYFRKVQALVALNNAEITAKLFEQKVNLGLENEHYLREFSPLNFAFWKRIIDEERLRKIVSMDFWISRLSQNPPLVAACPLEFQRTLAIVSGASATCEAEGFSAVLANLFFDQLTQLNVDAMSEEYRQKLAILVRLNSKWVNKRIFQELKLQLSNQEYMGELSASNPLFAQMLQNREESAHHKPMAAEEVASPEPATAKEATSPKPGSAGRVTRVSSGETFVSNLEMSPGR